MPRRSTPRRANLFGFHRRTATPCATRRSDLTIGAALARAEKAGEDSPDTGLFSQWLCAQGLHTRGAQLIRQLQTAYERGFEAKMDREASRESTRRTTPAPMAPMAHTPPMAPHAPSAHDQILRYKGATVEPTADGGWTTNLDRGSVFDTPGDARKFIDRWAKNPHPGVLVTKGGHMTAEQLDAGEARKLRAKVTRLSGATGDDARERKLAQALLKFYDQNGRFPGEEDYRLGPVGRNPGGMDVVDVYMAGWREGRSTGKSVGGDWKAWGKVAAPEQFKVWWKFHSEEVAPNVKQKDAATYWLKGFRKGLEDPKGNRNPQSRANTIYQAPGRHIAHGTDREEHIYSAYEPYETADTFRYDMHYETAGKRFDSIADARRYRHEHGIKWGSERNPANPGDGAQLVDFPEATVRMRQAATPRGGYQSAWGPWHYYADIRDLNGSLAGLQETADFRRVTFSWEVQRKEFGRWGYTSEQDKGKIKPRPKGGSRRNPENASDRLYEEFHGQPPTETVIVETPVHEHEHLAALGDLVELKVRTLSNLDATIDFEKQGVLLCSSEDGHQLYFEGGNQVLDLKELGMNGNEWRRDLMVIGELTETTYRTEKAFDKFQTIDYYHANGEDSGVPPELLYDPISGLMQVAGGQYEVRPEGIVN